MMSSGAFGAFAKCFVSSSRFPSQRAQSFDRDVTCFRNRWDSARAAFHPFIVPNERPDHRRLFSISSILPPKRGLFSFDSDCEERCDIHATACGNDPQYFFSCLRRCARYENKSQDGKDIQENTSDGNVSIIHHSFSSEKANDLRTTSRLPDTA